VLKDLDGLESNRLNQLVVRDTLQVTRDDDVFALGDCAACALPGSEPEPRWVPARAQAAHQQAAHLARQLERRLQGKPLQPWQYRDFGSRVALGRDGSVGHLMCGLAGRWGRGSLWIEGHAAWLMYVSLYRMHQVALHGPARAALDALSHLLARTTRPRVKLH
jgi:NADH dehydrogenase